jgi:hypothetical protein
MSAIEREIQAMDMFARQTPEGRFWSWFAANADEIGTITSGDNPLVEKLSDEVKRVHQDLVFEVGKAKDGTHEIIISADGIKAVIPHVETLVSTAPQIRGWRALAFRPRMEGVQLEFNGMRLSQESIYFTAEPSGDKLDLILYLDGLTQTNARQLMHACFLMLDAAIGEYDVMTRIDGIDFAPLIEADGKQRPLTELPRVVDKLKAS